MEVSWQENWIYVCGLSSMFYDGETLSSEADYSHMGLRCDTNMLLLTLCPRRVGVCDASGQQPERNPGIAPSVSSPEHHQAAGGSLVSAQTSPPFDNNTLFHTCFAPNLLYMTFIYAVRFHPLSLFEAEPHNFATHVYSNDNSTLSDSCQCGMLDMDFQKWNSIMEHVLLIDHDYLLYETSGHSV